MTSSDGVEIVSVENCRGFEVHDPNFPSQFTWWSKPLTNPRQEIRFDGSGTQFGFVQQGEVRIRSSSGNFTASAGMYFSIPGVCELETDGSGFVASRLDFRGFFTIGGPVEEKGRLEYIDGCSDSLLLSPVVLGDPCLNLLYLPPRTQQTQHTHPSCRLGMIISGEGICRTPDRDIALHPGMVFSIAPDAEHSFHTAANALRVIAWHPDSDFGPANADHPMINRTIVDGVSAAERRLAESSR